MGSTPIYSIPFADPTDLVRDWPALSEDVAEAVEAAVAGVPVLAGIGSNVVSVTKVDTFSTASKTFVDVTGLTVTITPTTATSKVLVMASLSISNPTNQFGAQGALLEGSTVIGGTSVSNRPSATFFSNRSAAARDGFAPLHFVSLREPATTDPVTYKIQIRTDQDGATTAFVNVSADDQDTANRPRLASSITVIEVAA